MSKDAEVLLVCMPFAHAFCPSIGLSLLKAALQAQGIPSRIRYFSIRFAELTGQRFYRWLSVEGRPSIEDLAGEWIFSHALFGPRARDEEYVDQILRKRATWTTNDATGPASPALIRRVLLAREQVDGFLEWCREEILRARPRVVGFTSTFQQHVASLALARLVKQAAPELPVVFGGANCEGVMGAETVRQFPFVDAVVAGEGDIVFPELARRLLDGKSICGLAGVRTRQGIEAEFASGRFAPGPMVQDLDALPYPDYGDYFEQFEASRFAHEWTPSLFFETSRGCWWGERRHCTFCGLNGETMAYRSKSPRRALDELTHLARRHPGCNIGATDSILDMGYFKDFIPELAALRRGPSLYYEVKSNLSKEQVRMLRDARIRRIQPGIESLSDPILRLMRKGVSALQNVQLLKWCKELGVEPSWNLIWGFPGEPAEEYRRMARLIPLLAHLPAPEDYGIIRLDRFSPNFDDAEQLGFEQVGPIPSYRYVYPLPDEALANLAHFFTFRYRDRRDVRGYVAPLEHELRAWQKREGQHDLFSVDLGKRLLVWDMRPGRHALLTVLAGVDRLLYQACDRASDLRRLADCLERVPEVPLSQDEIEQRLGPLVDAGLLLRDGPRYLALAVPLGGYSPPAPAVDRLFRLVRAVGRRVSEGWIVSAGDPVRPIRRAARALRARGGTCRRPSACRGRVPRLTPSHFSIAPQGDVLIRRTPLVSGH